MTGFEQGCVDVDAALAALEARLRELQGRLRKSRGAARVGDLRQLRDALPRLQADAGNVAAAATAALAAWPFDDAGELSHLRDGFVAELLAEAAHTGVELFERDGRLIAFPALIGVDATARRLRINKRNFPTLRPSAAVAMIRTLQTRASGFSPASFIAVLWRAWRVHNRDSTAARHQVGLLDLHETLTLLPSARKEYDLAEFGRDLLLLDESGLRTTIGDRTQQTLHLLRAATSSKGGRVVQAVDRAGQQIGYAAIDFRSTP